MGTSEALSRAASLWGIEPGYWDLWGHYHEACPEVRRAILQSLGVPACDEAQLTAAVEERLASEWISLTPRTLVVSEASAGVPVSLPAEQAIGPIRLQVHLESGEVLDRSYQIERLAVSQTAEVRGQCYQRRVFPLSAKLPLGYHRLEVTAGPLSACSHLIVTPDRAWLPPLLEQGGRAAGVAVSLYGLRSRRNWGCGDITDLENFIDWAARDLGVAFVALNPLPAIHNRQPFNTSP